MTNRISYTALIPKQGAQTSVCCFCATATDILSFAEIDRAGRDEKGHLSGFQRPQVAKHIVEIRDYLKRENAVLPNSIVVAFTKGAKLAKSGENNHAGTIEIDKESAVAYVVDGQQRLAALAELEQDFEVLVSAIFCDDSEELRKQFILINNSKPLPKQLIYELLPGVGDLPNRLTSRSFAASLVEQLNYNESSSLYRQIKQHTNPEGTIQDTVFQRVIMNSASDGAIRSLMISNDGLDESFRLLSNFFSAVQSVFEDAWAGHKPRTSRLVHGAGIVSMGYIMEYLNQRYNAERTTDFIPYLERLQPHTAWTKGQWSFQDGSVFNWNEIQNIPRDYMRLSQHLLYILRHQSLPA